MELTAHEYRLFFSKLKDRLFENEFKELVEKDASQKEIWNTLAKDENGENLNETFMSHRFGISPMLLIQKLTDANTKTTIPIKDFTFVRALEYLEGISIKSGYSGTEWRSHAKSLKETIFDKYKLSASIVQEDEPPYKGRSQQFPILEIKIFVEVK